MALEGIPRARAWHRTVLELLPTEASEGSLAGLARGDLLVERSWKAAVASGSELGAADPAENAPAAAESATIGD